MKELIIIGGGGAGSEAIFVARRMINEGTVGFTTLLGIVDDNEALGGGTIEGVPVIGCINEVLARFTGQNMHFHCAVGNNAARKRVSELLEHNGFISTSLIDPSAILAETASIGSGCYIAPQTYIGPCAKIGRHVLINVGASIGHHSTCGDYAQICPGGRISGYSTVGEGVFVGSNGVLAPGVTINEWATVGAASFVLREVAAYVTAIGVPAKALATPKVK